MRNPTPVPVATRAPYSKAYKYFVLAILIAVAIVNYMDRSVIAILQIPIKHDLSLSDTQLGLLTGLAFAVPYTLFGIPFGWIGDKVNRRNVVGRVPACVERDAVPWRHGVELFRPHVLPGRPGCCGGGQRTGFTSAARGPF